MLFWFLRFFFRTFNPSIFSKLQLSSLHPSLVKFLTEVDNVVCGSHIYNPTRKILLNHYIFNIKPRENYSPFSQQCNCPISERLKVSIHRQHDYRRLFRHLSILIASRNQARNDTLRGHRRCQPPSFPDRRRWESLRQRSLQIFPRRKRFSFKPNLVWFSNIVVLPEEVECERVIWVIRIENGQGRPKKWDLKQTFNETFLF